MSPPFKDLGGYVLKSELLVIQELILVSDVHWGGREDTPAFNSPDFSASYSWDWHGGGLATLFPYPLSILCAENTKSGPFLISTSK